MYWTNYSEAMILNSFRGITANAPTAVYAAAFLSNPGVAGGGTELSYSGYQRQPISWSTPAVSGGNVSIQNNTDIAFPTATAAAGTITYVAVMDSVSGGNMLAYMLLDEPIVVSAGVAPLIIAQEWNYVSSGNFSELFKMKALNWMRGTDLTGFTAHIALYNGNPDSGGAELSGSGYERFPVTFGAPEVQAAGQSMITNNAIGASPRALSNWGTWAYTVIFDAASAGSPVAYAQESPAQNMSKGKAVILDAGNLSVSLN